MREHVEVALAEAGDGNEHPEAGGGGRENRAGTGGRLAERVVLDALAQIRQARLLDPLTYLIANDVATILYCAGRYDEAIATARQTIETDPKFAPLFVIADSALAMKGDSAGAVASFEEAIRLTGRRWPWIPGLLGYALALAGHRSEAQDIAGEICDQEGPAVQIAFIQAALGQKQKAIDELERAVPHHEMDLNFIARGANAAGASRGAALPGAT